MNLVEEKIQQIAKEMQEANASPWTVTKIIKALSEMNISSEKRLRERALEMLKELDANAAIVYERFSRMKVYNSNETVKGFNRGHIITSLLRETGLSRSVAEKITLEVENELKDAKISMLTASLIRELVNAKLIAYGFEDVRNHYTRAGEPMYEIMKKLEAAPYSGEGVREYNILLSVPRKALDMHFEGAIYIEDIEGFSHRPFAYSMIAERKETLEKTVAAAVRGLVEKRKYFCLPPSIYGLTFACAPFAEGTAKAKRCAELIKEMLKVPEQGFALSLELFTPSVLEGFAADRINAAKISDGLAGEIGAVICVDSKYCLKMIDAKGKNFTILNNSAEEYFPLNGGLFAPTQGISLFVNINLEKMAQGGTEAGLFERLAEVAGAVQELKKKKMELLSKKSYLKEFKPEEMKAAVGLTSLVQAGENIPGAKPLEFANRLYKEIQKLFPEELLFGLAGEKARKRFCEATSKDVHSQEVLDFEECLKEKRCCFIGKASSIKEVNELLDNKTKRIEFVGQS